MTAENLRAPWWQWALFSLGSLVVDIVLLTGAIIWIAFQGVDPTEYIELARPTYITDGMVAAGFALLLLGQVLGSVLLIPLFRPARLAVAAWWKSPRSGYGKRLVLGALATLGLQLLWTYVGPVPAERFRMVDHLVYAVVGGGRFWPVLWILAVVVVVAPLAEELLFRGVAFGLLRRRWRFWPAALATAAVFGLAHGLANALPTALLALWFAWQVEQDDSLAGAMVLHALNNLGAVLAMIYLSA